MTAVWNAALAGELLVEAFVTLDRLPRVRGPRAPGGHWPSTIAEWADQLAQAELEASEQRSRQQTANRIVIQPSSAEITRMEMVFGLLGELRRAGPDLACIVSAWALRTARGGSVKRLCFEKHWAPHTFFRKRLKALTWLAGVLDSRGIPVTPACTC